MLLGILFTPLAARANPASLDPTSLLAFCVVAFWALVMESGVVALVLTLRGLQTLPAFAALFSLNFVVFLFLFCPLLERGGFPLAVLEALVVVVDSMAVKLVACFSWFQGGGFRGVSWSRAVVVSLLGNSVSYFVGVIAAGEPWVIHTLE
jgi:hypothetical protein